MRRRWGGELFFHVSEVGQVKREFISIDQNGAAWWDVAPKLAALTSAGYGGTHYVEDVDTAFSRHGAAVDDSALALAPEAYYRGGASDWGATLFYDDFLGRLPLELRTLEPFVGLTVAALAKRLQLSLDDLYAAFSGADNVQLVGTSYVAGDKYRHRVLGDVTGAEVAPFLRQMLQHVTQNIRATFPAAHADFHRWLAAETAFLNGAERAATVADFYRDWLTRSLAVTASGAVPLRTTSHLFSLTAAPERHALSHLFLRDYAQFAALYNGAVAACPTGVKPLEQKHGELPFFAVFRRAGRMFREQLFIAASGGEIFTRTGEAWQVADGKLPVEKLSAAGVIAVVGKALLLVLQARLYGHDGGAAPALALPEQGSLYMPAAYELQWRLAPFLPRAPAPVWRVGLNFLAALRQLSVPVCPPPYLHYWLGAAEIAAPDLAEALAGARARATALLTRLRDAAQREAAWQEIFPATAVRRQELEFRRRELAADPQRRHEASALWDEIRALDLTWWREKVAWLSAAVNCQRTDYYAWRGAIYPWALALGGADFYRCVIAAATIREEELPPRLA
jgi:hypothetical protein